MDTFDPCAAHFPSTAEDDCLEDAGLQTSHPSPSGPASLLQPRGPRGVPWSALVLALGMHLALAFMPRILVPAVEVPPQVFTVALTTLTPAAGGSGPELPGEGPVQPSTGTASPTPPEPATVSSPPPSLPPHAPQSRTVPKTKAPRSAFKPPTPQGPPAEPAPVPQALHGSGQGPSLAGESDYAPGIETAGGGGSSGHGPGHGTAGSGPLDATSVEIPPKLLSRVDPTYPMAARRRSIEGTVVVRILVARDGQVEEVRIDTAAPAGIFDDAILQALPQWRFQPAEHHGQPVAVWVRVPIQFRLRS